MQRCFVINNISDSAATKIARLETRSYRKNFELLVARVTEGFSNIAKVPEVNVDWFTANLVNEMARWLLVEARTRIGIGKSAIQFFDAIEKVAQYLRQALARIEPAYLEEQWTGEHSPSVLGEEIYFLEFHLRLGDILSQSPQPSNVSALRATLANVATAARNHRYMIQDDVGVHPKRGRPRGPTRFRDLETLVFGLEFIARLAGGRFTLDRALGKGTLLDALDAMKARLHKEAEWSWIARFMPPPNKHSLSTYQRILGRARRWSEWHSTQRR